MDISINPSPKFKDLCEWGGGEILRASGGGGDRASVHRLTAAGFAYERCIQYKPVRAPDQGEEVQEPPLLAGELLTVQGF